MSNGRLGDNLEDNALLCFLLKSPSFQTASRRDVLVLVQPLSVWILLIGAGHARQWCMTLPEVRFRISIRPAMSVLILSAVTRLPIYVTLSSAWGDHGVSSEQISARSDGALLSLL